MKTNGQGNIEAMGACVETSAIDNSINLVRVQPAFCAGAIEAGASISQAECEILMEDRQWWPTLKGTYTSSWNKRFPYPLSALGTAVVQPNQSRTGDRDTNDREGFDRSDEPTTTTEGEEG